VGSDPILIIGLLVAVAVGVAAGFLGGHLGVLLGIMITLLASVLTFQIDTLLRIERRHREGEDGSRILHLLEEQPELIPVIRSISEAAAEIFDQDDEPVFIAAAQMQLESLVHGLNELRLGTLRVGLGDAELMEEALPALKVALQATTHLHTDLEWWESPTGRRYWAENIEALKRGVQITRVFFGSEREVDDRWLNIAREQASAGVDVLIVDPSDVSPDLCINMVVFDHRLVHEVLTNNDGCPVAYTYDRNPAAIARAREKMRRLRSHAQSLSESEVRVKPAKDSQSESDELTNVQEQVHLLHSTRTHRASDEASGTA
jgi:hypothetical protein